jgi:hypothetical protein
MAIASSATIVVRMVLHLKGQPYGAFGQVGTYGRRLSARLRGSCPAAGSAEGAVCGGVRASASRCSHRRTFSLA